MIFYAAGLLKHRDLLIPSLSRHPVLGLARGRQRRPRGLDPRGLRGAGRGGPLCRWAAGSILV